LISKLKIKTLIINYIERPQKQKEKKAKGTLNIQFNKYIIFETKYYLIILIHFNFNLFIHIIIIYTYLNKILKQKIK